MSVARMQKHWSQASVGVVYSIPSQLNFSAVDAASTVDYSKGLIEDGVVNSPPNKTPMPLKSPSPSPLRKRVATTTSSGSMGDPVPHRQLQMGICTNKDDVHELELCANLPQLEEMITLPNEVVINV